MHFFGNSERKFKRCERRLHNFVAFLKLPNLSGRIWWVGLFGESNHILKKNRMVLLKTLSLLGRSEKTFLLDKLTIACGSPKLLNNFFAANASHKIKCLKRIKSESGIISKVKITNKKLISQITNLHKQARDKRRLCDLATAVSGLSPVNWERTNCKKENPFNLLIHLSDKDKIK